MKKLREKVGEHFDWEMSNDSEFVRCVAKAMRGFHRREAHTRAEDMSRFGDILMKTRALGMPNVCGKLDGGR